MSRPSAPSACGCVLVALVLLAGCDRKAPPTPPSGAPAAEAAAPTPASAPRSMQRLSLPGASGYARASIGTESRPVLAAHATHLLRWNDGLPIETTRLRIETPLPADLTARGALLIEHRISVRDPSAANDFRELRTGGRIALPVPAQVLAGGAALPGHVVAELAVPPELVGASALVSVIARELPEAARTRLELPALAVAAGARLDFGYGIEEMAWGEGFPPVLFRVTARPAEAGALPSADTEHVLFERRVDPVRDPRDRRWLDASLVLDSILEPILDPDVRAAPAGPADPAGAAARDGSAPPARRRVTLAFETIALGDAPGVRFAQSLPVVSQPRIVAGPRRGGERPNVLLVSLDTLRAHSIGLYGHVRDTMPNLEARLAAPGAWFEHATAAVPFTPPSHMTLLTGLEPCAHGVHDRHGQLARGRTTLAEHLQRAGYHTAAVTEDAYVVAGAGFERGFDRYLEFRSDESAAPGFAAETFEAAARWLDASAREPFFLFVHTYQVHDPYEPPRAYRDVFDDGRQLAAKPEWNEALRRYEQEIRYTDDLLAGLLDALDATGLADHTLLIVTSDHGEGFGEHLVMSHGYSLFDEETRVPLVVRAPGLVAPGTRVREQVGLVDVAPSLLELVGLPVPGDMMGRSFASLLTGRGTPFQERPVLSQTIGETYHAARTRKWKVIVGRRKPDAPLRRLVYRLDDDPGERRDVAGEAPGLLAQGEAAIAAGREACEAWQAAHPAPAEPEAARFESLPGWFLNRDEIDDMLRALGYAE